MAQLPNNRPSPDAQRIDDRRRDEERQRRWRLTLPHKTSGQLQHWEFAKVDSTDSAITLYLPSARLQPRSSIRVKWIAGGNAVTLRPVPGELLDAAASYAIPLLLDSLDLFSDETGWWLV